MCSSAQSPEPVTGLPPARFRPAGDSALLVEYGEAEFDLRLNFLVHAVQQRMREAAVPGVLDLVPGLRSLMVNFDPDLLGYDRLISVLREVHGDLPGLAELVLPSRSITLPIAFDDPGTLEAIRRYAEAHPGRAGTDIDRLVEFNGLAGRDEFFGYVLGTTWWVAFTGYFPGQPFLYPMTCDRLLVAPKYNPPRAWTQEGAVSMGGPSVSIMPLEGPGGYQMLGRTLPIMDMRRTNKAFKADPLLLRPADRIGFHLVSGERLSELRSQVFSGEFDYRIDDGEVAVREFLEQPPRLAVA
ncbi:carboxyltransferase domain-containing protein [Pseudonocardiaceae bacterium YIM PH 21723]|nr:carboxyltransferase domain-containing protein [Pseudonocardiaceae bacterium YIM PH 21723]